MSFSTFIDRLLQGVVCVVSVPLSVSGSDQLVVNKHIQPLRLGVEDRHDNALREGKNQMCPCDK